MTIRPPLHGIFRRPPFAYSLDFAHLRLWEIMMLSPSVVAAVCSYRSLIFVRDPYRRFVSAIDQHFKTYYPDLVLSALLPSQQMLIIEIFVEKVLSLEAVRTSHRFVHFSPQVWFLQSCAFSLRGNIVPVDDQGGFIARGLESLNLPPTAIPHDNRSRHDLTHVLTSPKIRTFVDEFYAKDFAFFAADPALAHWLYHALVGPAGKRPSA